MTFDSTIGSSVSNLLDTYSNAFGSTYLSYDGDYYSYPNGYRGRGNLTGAVIQYYNNGQMISEETIDFDEKNKEELEKVRKDLLAAQEEHAKKACLRLTNCFASEDGKIYTYDTGEDMTDKVLAELRGDSKRLVYAGSDVIDALSSIDPVCFEGWELVVVDAEVKESLTDLPKSIDGFTDETVEEYTERIRERGRVKRTIEKQAVRDAEIDKGLQMTQRRWDLGR